MNCTCLHISDFHFREGDSYDRDVVLRALIKSVSDFRSRGHTPDIIFATGDIAYSGRAAEYEVATHFFNDLLDATCLDRNRLYLVPGNHDVYRPFGIGLARTLSSREEADMYFGPDMPVPHLSFKQGAFLDWYDKYFSGIRSWPKGSTFGPVEACIVGGKTLGILPINTAIFCQDEHDHEKLWVGRRRLDSALEDLQRLDATLNVALMHHPLDWLHEGERSNIKASLQSSVDMILRGHLHVPDAEAIASVHGSALHFAAGAAYQTRKYPNRASYYQIDGDRIVVFPIRYEDQPQEVWTVDPSVFPLESEYQKSFPLPRFPQLNPALAIPSPAKEERVTTIPRFRSNIPSRRNLPFVGRDDLLKRMSDVLGESSRESALVLHGEPGVGKTELAREFARRQLERYPGGIFFIDFGSGGLPIDFATVGTNLLRLDFAVDLSLSDQCTQALYAFGAEPTLLIYDNVPSVEVAQAWLPPAGMPCHVLITTVVENWDPGWLLLHVEALSDPAALQLVEKLAGREIAEKYGQRITDLAGGLPIQICPSAVTLAYEMRRGRLDSAELALSREAENSFRGVFENLESEVKLLLHAAAHLNPQRISRVHLCEDLRESSGWSDADMQRWLDVCLDLHLLQGKAELRMHQLFAHFLLDSMVEPEIAKSLDGVKKAQKRRLVELASKLSGQPADAELAAKFTGCLSFDATWRQDDSGISIEDGAMIGRALYEIGKYDEALPWYERAVAAKEKGDIHGRVDSASLGTSMTACAECLWRLGRTSEAKACEERADGLEH